MPAFTFKRAVRFDEVDAAGLVYFPRVVALAHEGLEQLLAAALPGGYPAFVVGQKIGLPCVHVESDFKGPLRFGDDVEVTLVVAGFGTSSVAFDVEVQRGDGNPCAKMRYIVACADLSESPKKRAIPPELRTALAKHLR
jgi:4-hydroxybenzoyl-CoA thioesterase